VPSQIQAQLTWNNGTPQSWVTYTTTGHSAGDVYVLDTQVSSAVTSTGLYPWQVEVKVTIGGNTIDRIVAGTAVIVVNNSSSPYTDYFGQGWSLAGLDKLVIGGSGVGWVYGTGGTRYFIALTGGAFLSPPNDFGSLQQNLDNSYTYTAKNQVKWYFDSSGNLTKVVDPHGLTVTYTYASGRLSTEALPDGGVGTFSYDGNNLLSTIAEPGGRTVTVTHDGSGNLTGLVNPDGGLRTFTYDGSYRVTNQQWGPTSATYSYDATNGLLTSVNLGASTTLNLIPAAVQGLATSPAISSTSAVGALTDALSRVTSYTLDSQGRLSQLQRADGSLATYTLDFAGQPIKYTDPLGHVTQAQALYGPGSGTAGAGDITQITYADNSTIQFQFNGTFHTVTVRTDQLGHSVTMTYDATTGDLLTVKDALNNVTTYTWSNGLLQTVTDPLNRVTTYQYYTGTRKLQDTIDALNDRTTYSYDAAGNLTVTQDTLNRLTTVGYDGMRRPTSVQNAAGGTVTMAYNAMGEMTSTTDQLGRITNFSYDGHGWRTAVTEAAGTALARTTTSLYDVVGNVTGTQDPRASLTQFQYDSLNRVTVTIDALSNRVTTMYDAASNVTGVKDQRGNLTTFQYDALNRKTVTIDALSNRTTVLLDAAGNVTGIQDPRNNLTQFQYDALNRKTVTIDALSERTTTLYDGVGNVTEIIDARNNATQFQYDALNRQTVMIDALSGRTTTLYDAVSNVTGVQHARGYLTQFQYDSLNRLTVTIDALSNRTTVLYDAASNVTGIQDARGNLTQFQYDALNRQTVTIDALTHRTTTLFDAADNVTGVQDVNGNLTQFQYDALNRKTVTIDALSNRSTVLFDAAGNVTGVQDARSNLTTFQYDALNRLTVTIDALGNRTTALYDAASNVTGIQDPRGNLTQFQYDALNRQTITVDALFNRSTVLLDAVGNVTGVQDPRADLTQFQYDALNRRTVTIDALTYRTTTAFDAVGNATGVTDASGNLTQFSYDALNRVTQMTDPYNKNVTYAYDGNGNLTSTTDQTGRVQSFSFDALNRTTTAVWLTSGTAVNTLTYSFDNNGNLLNAANNNGAYTMTYDALNRATVVLEPFGQTLTFTYDANSNRTKVQDSKGGTTTSVYDADNNLTSRQFSGNSQTLRFDYTYTPTNQIGTATRYSDLNATTTIGSSSYTYDSDNRVSNLQHKNGAGTTVLANYTYVYDAASNVTSQTENGTNTTMTYDAVNQLTQWGPNQWTFDKTGNRTNTGYTTGTGNRLTNDGTWTYSYDDAGNLTKKTKGSNAETWTYGYDTLNEMTWAEDRQTDGGTLIQRVDFKYDVFGNRIEQDVNTGTTVTTRFAMDGWKWSGNVSQPVGNENWDVWADLDASNNLLVRYVNGDSVDQHAARVIIGGANAGVAWYLTDRQGSVRNLTDSGGTLQDTIVYDGWGNVTSESNAAFGDRYKWTGREADTTGLQYNRGRYYDPKTGRWTTPDPMGFGAGSTNLYQYAGNNAVNRSDPSGLLIGAPSSSVVSLPATLGAPHGPIYSGMDSLTQGAAQVQNCAAPAGNLATQPQPMGDRVGMSYDYYSTTYWSYHSYDMILHGPNPLYLTWRYEVLINRPLETLIAYNMLGPGLGPRRYGGMPSQPPLVIGGGGAGGGWGGFPGFGGGGSGSAGDGVPSYDPEKYQTAEQFWLMGAALVQFMSNVGGGIMGAAGHLITHPWEVFTGLPMLVGSFIVNPWGTITGIWNHAIQNPGQFTGEVIFTILFGHAVRPKPKWCFPAGTRVATWRGLRPIETIKADEQVWAFDLVASEWRPCRVLETFRNEYDAPSVFVTLARETIESTALHPFWVVHGKELDTRPRRDHLPSVPDGATTEGRWVDAVDLRIGDEVLLRDGRIMPVERIDHSHFHGDVYNFEVEALHCYAVGENSVLVHNSNGAPESTPRAQWQADVKGLRETILEVEEQLAGIERRGRNWGYGPHRATGTESYLAQLYKQLADLIANEPT
jgi:RHS repeat-associated protein